jgi:hypothetical protein
MSYPKGKQDVVCYHYEPWHYRYYGRDLAKKIHDSGLTPREYLWANYTQFHTDLSPVVTARPSAAPSPDANATPGTSGLSEPSMGIGGASVAPASPAPAPAAAAKLASGGVEPMVMVAVVLLALAAIGLVSWMRSPQRQRRRRG